MKKRIVSVIVVLTMVIATLTGCGSSGSAATGPNTLEKVIKNQKLIVGCILANEPYGSYDEQGKPIGYDVDVTYLLADSLGISHDNVEFIDVTAAERIPALETGKVDVVIGNFTITLERAQKVTFTDPYDAGATSCLVRADSTISKATDLAGLRVSASKGSTNQASGEKLIASGIDLELVLFDSGDEQELALQNGQIDAIIGDSPYCAYKAKTYPDKFKNVINPEEMLNTPFYNGFGVQKNDTEWFNYLNQFIFQINTNGQNTELYTKWLGQPLNVPLNPNY